MQVVRDLAEARITQEEIAGATNANLRSVQNWAKGETRPRAESRDRLLEVHYIAKKLREFLSPEGVEIWLHSRSRWLDEERPIDLLMEGQFDAVLRAIAQISNGEY